jgi:hypothetical protein
MAFAAARRHTLALTLAALLAILAETGAVRLPRFAEMRARGRARAAAAVAVKDDGDGGEVFGLQRRAQAGLSHCGGRTGDESALYVLPMAPNGFLRGNILLGDPRRRAAVRALTLLLAPAVQTRSSGPRHPKRSPPQSSTGSGSTACRAGPVLLRAWCPSALWTRSWAPRCAGQSRLARTARHPRSPSSTPTRSPRKATRPTSRTSFRHMSDRAASAIGGAATMHPGVSRRVFLCVCAL